MEQRSMFVGMDVHRESIDISVAEDGPWRQRARNDRQALDGDARLVFGVLVVEMWR